MTATHRSGHSVHYAIVRTQPSPNEWFYRFQPITVNYCTISKFHNYLRIFLIYFYMPYIAIPRMPHTLPANSYPGPFRSPQYSNIPYTSDSGATYFLHTSKYSDMVKITIFSKNLGHGPRNPHGSTPV